MPALIPTRHTGEIVWLGHVADRDAKLASDPVSEIAATFAGFAAESHGGLTRPSDTRVAAQYPLNTEIRNTRQFSILSQEELDIIAAEMGIAEFDPAWAGASIVVRGIPDFSLVPPSSRLQTQNGTTLTVDMQNRPCVLPAAEIDAAHPGIGRAFKPAAKNRRGITAWVEREGLLRIGDIVRLHIPDQAPWPHTA